MTASAHPIDTHPPTELGPADAVALSRALLAALSAEHGVTATVRHGGRALRTAADALEVAWEASVRAAVAADHGASARRADRDEDAVWLALYHWLRGWALLPPSLAPEADSARVVLDALFPRGPRLTGFNYALEWAEAERLLALIDADGHAGRIEALGGATMLRALRAAHQAYERALGVSHAAGVPSDPTGAALAPLLDELVRRLGDYVAAVATSVDPGEPATVARAEALLAPMWRWKTEQAARRAAG